MFKRFRCKIPMDLQIFAQGAGEGAGGSGGTEPGQTGNAGQQAGTNQPGANAQNQQNAAQTIDYGKIQQMLDGTLAAKEDTALKAYFRQQGMSAEEMNQAIADFKAQKAKNTPDISVVQAQAAAAQEQVRKAAVENTAILQAVALGIDAKTIPYVMKMADFSSVVGQDGKISEESVKAALNKVLEDVPALKPTAASQAGFVKVGASGSGGSTETNDDALKKAFGL